MSEWIRHDGGPMPVEQDAEIAVKSSTGVGYLCGRAWSFTWDDTLQYKILGNVATMSDAPTGNDVNYYLVEIKNPKRLAKYMAEAEDIIEALGMTFAEGCAFKAIWRSCAARTLGVVKPGMDEHGIYDAQKTIYYGKRMLAQREYRRDNE